MEKITYGGWENCYRLANDKIELIVTTDVGPRIIRASFIGGDNMLKEFDEMMGLTGGEEWRIYGGHRLWIAPEVKPRTYYPDNFPVEIEDGGSYIKLRPPLEETTGIQKEIEISLSATENKVVVLHRLINKGSWDVELAPWALTVMAPGGVGIVPLPPRRPHTEDLLPASTMTLWSYTNLADERFELGNEYLMLRSNVNATTPQKVGFSVPDGWVGYANAGQLFVKCFDYDADAIYPDKNSSVELFTNNEMLEVESCAPMATLAVGASVEHLETWHLFDDVKTPSSPEDMDEIRARVDSVL